MNSPSSQRGEKEDKLREALHKERVRLSIALAVLFLLTGTLLFYFGKSLLREVTRAVVEHRSPSLRMAKGCIASPLASLTLMNETSLWGCDAMQDMYRTSPGRLINDGFWRDVFRTSYRGRDVVYKKMKSKHDRNDRNLKRHRWEAAALWYLREEPHIVPLLGYCNYDIVTPYLPRSLEDVLERQPTLGNEERLSIALQVARGMHSASGGPIVHADLQPRQIMQDVDGTWKINDLNRLRFLGLPDTHHHQPTAHCTVHVAKAKGIWRAPEEFTSHNTLDQSIDVYSTALIFWSLFGGMHPFERHRDGEKDYSYQQDILAGRRPWLPRRFREVQQDTWFTPHKDLHDDEDGKGGGRVGGEWHDGLVELMQRMWQTEPGKRPSMGEVVSELEGMIGKLAPSG